MTRRALARTAIRGASAIGPWPCSVQFDRASCTLQRKYRRANGGHLITIDSQLMRKIEGELRQIAVARLRSEGACSLSAGDLINEAMVRILDQRELNLKKRSEVLALAAYMMRRVVVDHARRKQAAKRSHQPVTLHSQIPGVQPVDLLDLETQLHQLAKIDEERVRLVEMRFYGGMTLEEVADATGMSIATVNRRWAATRAWLQDKLEIPS